MKSFTHFCENFSVKFIKLLKLSERLQSTYPFSASSVHLASLPTDEGSIVRQYKRRYLHLTIFRFDFSLHIVSNELTQPHQLIRKKTYNNRSYCTGIKNIFRRNNSGVCYYFRFNTSEHCTYYAPVTVYHNY